MRENPGSIILLVCAALAGTIVAVLVAGCATSTSNRAAAGSSQQALQAMRELAHCIRSHGLPGFPDPQVGSGGVPIFPDSAPHVPAGTQHACAGIAQRLPARDTSTQPVSTVDYQKLLRFARCMRAHAIPDWPDPNPLGEFPIDQRILAGGKRLFRGAMLACARLNPIPAGGIHVVRAR